MVRGLVDINKGSVTPGANDFVLWLISFANDVPQMVHCISRQCTYMRTDLVFPAGTVEPSRFLVDLPAKLMSTVCILQGHAFIRRAWPCRRNTCRQRAYLKDVPSYVMIDRVFTRSRIIGAGLTVPMFTMKPSRMMYTTNASVWPTRRPTAW